MKLSRENKLRPKFLAAILILLGVVFLIGGLYTLGLWLPMFLASIPLLVTSSDNVIGVIPIKVIQITFLLMLISGVVIHSIYGVAAAVGWYLTASLLSISFRVVRIALVAVGFIGLMPNA